MNDTRTASLQQARLHEQAGDFAAAEAIHRALIRSDPRQVTPQLRLSRFAQWRDDYTAARRHAHAAAAAVHAGRGVADAGFVSMRLLEFSDYADAIGLIETLDWSSAAVQRQAPVLIQHLWLAGAYEQASAHLDVLLARLPDHAMLHYLHGNVLRALGAMVPATQAYQRTVQLAPDFGEGWWALVQHERTASPDARIDVLKTLLARADDDANRRYLAQALFKALDDAGRHDAAWAALEQALALRRAGSRHDRSEEAARFAGLMAHRWPFRPESPDVQAATPLFIVGMPRTGTTVLERLLGNHSRIESAGERNDFDAALSEVSGHFHRGGLHESDPARYDGIDMAAVGRRYRERIGQAPDGVYYVIDKNPQNLFNVGWILQALPQARVVCMRRDPADAAFSNLKALFEGGAYPYSHDPMDVAAHVRGAQALMAHWQASAPGAVQVVDYEAMVADPEATARTLCKCLGIVYEPYMAEIERNAAPVNTASSSQVREPIHRRAVGAWQAYAGPLAPMLAALAPPSA